ncbi:metal ABC transporter ATP-binding protein [Lacticaseibacillus yichunensis]|uniref:Metal ABC transporter ATP-binding protein n=1 Tax=Lacticaseibacillus yichunensis TaxID=2486015 RepID=A0ABW4CPP3_9LACO|nr:metal ABC transporter ATP-binding protein [Lacticaseibacillus yichunensis]
MLRVKGLSAAYEGTPIFSDVSVDFAPGKITGIIGPNGAGKSTLIKNMLNLVKPVNGYADFNGVPLVKQAASVAYIEQRAEIDLTFPIDVLDVIVMGTYPKLGWFKVPGKTQRAQAKAALSKVGLSDFAHRQIGNLSGGQLQRVFVARAIVQEAPLVFMDEPFVGIDMQSEAEIIRILKEWRAAGKTIVVVHHDLNKVSQYFDELVIMSPGAGIVAHGPVDEVFTQANIQAAFSPDLGNVLFGSGKAETAGAAQKQEVAFND